MYTLGFFDRDLIAHTLRLLGKMGNSSIERFVNKANPKPLPSMP